MGPAQRPFEELTLIIIFPIEKISFDTSQQTHINVL
tara:strand:- start:23983 stop:24090 length:108 start_codon:yes stop_codon:yes gene_type:complete